MLRRVRTLILTGSALLALALGGAVMAQAASNKHHRSFPTHKVTHSAPAAQRAASSSENGSSDRSGSEQAAQSTESSSEEATGDGPGGHEDPAGAEVDHQFEGEE